MSEADSPPAPTRKPCPICGKPSVAAYRPFCSKRCADIDLSRWLTGVYVVAGTDEDEDNPASPGSEA